MKTLTLVEGDNLWCSKRGCHICDINGIVKKVNNNIELLLENEIYDRIFPVIIEERRRRGCDECGNTIIKSESIEKQKNDCNTFSTTLEKYQKDMDILLNNKKEEYENILTSYNTKFTFEKKILENLINHTTDRLNMISNILNTINTENVYNPISFTGSHSVCIDITKQTLNMPMNFGKIVSSTGNILYNTCPYIKLSSEPNDKRVFGVLNNEIGKKYGVNSVGEGGIWVSDINGTIENGDYITTSIIPGYGQRQEDDLLHNYTVAKITMDCDFTQPLKTKQVAKMEVHEYEVEEELRDASGELVYETVNVLDENGNPMMETIQMVEQNKTEERVKRVMVTKTEEREVLDENGKTVWVAEEDASRNPIMVPAYQMRYLLVDGTEISKEDYEEMSGVKYRAAFVGCTYHCG